MHLKYRVMGCKVRYKPANYWGSDGAVREMANCWIASCRNLPNDPLTQPEAQKLVDYK